MTELFDQYYDTMDGAYSEGYAYNLLEAYNETAPEVYVTILSRQDKHRIKAITELLASEVVFSEADVQEFTSGLFNLLDRKDITDREKFIIYNTYAYILYCQVDDSN